MEDASVSIPKRVQYGGGVILFGLLIWLISSQFGGGTSAMVDEEFALTLVVKEGLLKEPVRKTLGKVQVLIGDKDLGRHTLNEEGTVVIPNIASNYLDSTVKIQFDQRIRVLSPLSPPTPRQGKRLEFAILPQGTMIAGKVEVEFAGRYIPAENATLELGLNGKKVTTNKEGSFLVFTKFGKW